MQIRTLPWYGGKAGRVTGTGAWISKLIGADTECAYVEPFAGMCGVLLQRPKSSKEIINDLDLVVSNWWQVVREERDALIKMVDWTPSRSRPLYEECLKIISEPPSDEPVRHAWALAVVQQQSLMSRRMPHGWAPIFSTEVGVTRMLTAENLRMLADRMRDVQLECCDAVSLLERIANKEDCLIYADPPYQTADTDPYLHDINHEELAEALLKQSGRVACSGYPGEMPLLEEAGWRRHDFTTTVQIAREGDTKKFNRVECLWMNYEPILTLFS